MVRASAYLSYVLMDLWRRPTVSDKVFRVKLLQGNDDSGSERLRFTNSQSDYRIHMWFAI